MICYLHKLLFKKVTLENLYGLNIIKLKKSLKPLLCTFNKHFFFLFNPINFDFFSLI